MKKTFALILALAMMLGMLAGCSSSNDNETQNPSGGGTNAPAGNGEVRDVKLKVWVPEEDLEITQQMAESFNAAHPEYNFSIDLSVVGIDEANGMLETDADTAADIMTMPSGSIPSEVARGLLLPIVYEEETVRSLYGESALDACTVTTDDGTYLYAIPFSGNCFFLFYNKEMYTEDDVQSLETMMAKDLGDGVYNFSCDLTDSWYIESFFYAAGCTLFGPDGTDPTDCSWNDANGLAAGKYLLDLAKNPKYVDNEKSGIHLNYFGQGKLAAFCSGNWHYEAACDAIGEENVGACKLPTVKINGKDSQLRNFADYKTFAIKSNTSEPLVAQQFVQWINNEENQLLRYQTNNTVPTLVTLMDDPMLEENVASVALIEQSSIAAVQPSIDQMGSYWDPASALGQGILYGEITEANLQTQLDALVDSVTGTLVG